jgi:hypothetical protein
MLGPQSCQLYAAAIGGCTDADSCERRDDDEGTVDFESRPGDWSSRKPNPKAVMPLVWGPSRRETLPM